MAEKNQTLEIWDNHGELILTGSSNAYIAETARPIVGYFRGLRLCARANHTNTGAATLNVNGIGATAIRKGAATALASGDIVSGKYYDFIYDDVNSVFQIFALVDDMVKAAANLVNNALVVGDGGGAGIKTISSSLPSPPNDDFDDVTETGFAATGNTATNRPADFTIVLTLMRLLSPSRFAQVAFETTASVATAWIRQVGSTVTSWVRMLTTDDIIDEDDMVSNSASRVPTQQSVKAYVDASGGGIAPASVQATTSGTAIDFSGISSGVNRITVIFDQVDLSGTDDFWVQIGDSGGVETTSYLSQSGHRAGETSSTSAFHMRTNGENGQWNGKMYLERITGNTWISSHVMGSGNNTPPPSFGSGSKTLSAELDRVRVTRSGTNTFAGGQVNIFYE